MSVQALAWVLDQSQSEGSDRLVLIAIANHIGRNPDDGAWPSQETLAREARVSRRTVQRSVGQLVTLGELIVDAHAGPSERADRRPNVYRLAAFSRGDNLTPRDGERGDTGDATGRHLRQNGATAVTPRTVSEPSRTARAARNTKRETHIQGTGTVETVETDSDEIDFASQLDSLRAVRESARQGSSDE